MYGTTKTFLDDFNLKTLEQLPSLMQLKDLGYAENEEVPAENISKPPAESATASQTPKVNLH